MAEDRDRLQTTFDGAALLYDEVRPGYPEELFDDVVSLSGIPSGGRVLEVGCGTGQATLPFARQGYEVLCVELGENLAAVARRNLAPYPKAEVGTGDFEECPVPEGAFDLAISATAFHWLDPAVAYPKVARGLRPGGALALFWNEHVRSDASGDIFEAAQEVYECEAPEMVKPDDHKGLSRPEDLPDRAAEIEASGLFAGIIRRDYLWDEPYDAEGYLRVLGTYSGHMALDPTSRERLFGGIRDLIEREYGGRIVKGYATTLYLAHRKEAREPFRGSGGRSWCGGRPEGGSVSFEAALRIRPVPESGGAERRPAERLCKMKPMKIRMPSNQPQTTHHGTRPTTHVSLGGA